MNNYKAVNQAEKFRESLMKPMEESIKVANNVIGDSTYPWTSEDQKEKAIAKKKHLEETLEQYQQMYDAVYDLAKDHEGVIDELVKQYLIWHKDISYDGVQQREMMQGQADLLQGVFRSIFKIIKTVNKKENLIPDPK